MIITNHIREIRGVSVAVKFNARGVYMMLYTVYTIQTCDI